MGTGRFGGRGSSFAGARDAMEGSAAAPERDMMHGGAHDDDTPEANRKFKKGDLVKGLNAGDKPEKVMSVNHPMVHTYSGKSYHHTKLNKVGGDAHDAMLTPSEKTEFEGLKKKREHAGRLANHEQARFEQLRDKIGRISFASAGAQRKRAGDRKACAA